MGGFFGVVSSDNCVSDLFFGTDYHSHLGNQRGGLLIYGKDGFVRNIHDIRNSQFRSKFQYDVDAMNGNMGIGAISDTGDQPLMAFSHLGTFGIVTVGAITNLDSLTKSAYRSTRAHFSEMTGEDINPTEMVASLISLETSYADGIRSAQQKIQGSCSFLMLTREGIYAVRDRYGRTPVVIGLKKTLVEKTRTVMKDGVETEETVEEEQISYAATFETCAFQNLDYEIIRWLGPGETVLLTPNGIEEILPALPEMKMCAFMWVYYGYPASCYEDINVEAVRYRLGAALARREDKDIEVDAVAGVPDSGTAPALGYAQESHLPYIRSFVKYTPTWPRSFIPQDQRTRRVVAKMKLISIPGFIKGQRLLFCEDSIVRGTQLRDTFARLPDLGAKEVHVRSACPPILFNCKYLNFSRSKSLLELASRRAIQKLEGDCEAHLDEYTDCTTERYAKMVDEIRKELGLQSLRYQTLEDLIEAVGLPRERLCTYCWDGRE